MPAFDLTANITFQAAGLGALNKSIKNQLKVEAPVTLKFDPSSRQNAKALEVQLRSFNKELANVSKNATSAAAAVKQLGQAFSKVGTGVAQAAKTQQSMKKIAQSTQEATSQIEEFGRVSGLALRRNAGFLIATGVVFGFVNAVKTAFADSVKFERQLVKVAQVTGKTIGTLGSLTKEITKLSTGLGVSSEDLIEVAQTLAQAGLSAKQTEQALGALAKTTLAATFGDIADTTEGAIALMAQFGIEAKDLEKALSSVNSVAGAFAVESDDIIAAIKRAGGVFASTSKGVSQGADALNEFIAVFTSVRSTTRESAETIATGLRTIFTRIQRPQTIQFLRELGISLTDVEGKFVGPFEAVNRLSKGLTGLDTRNPLFARVIEELGGFRQVGKVIPLLAQTEVRMKALAVAQQGLNSLNDDSAQAQQSLAVQIQKTRESFLALIRDISQTSTFRAITESILGITNSIIGLADAIKPVLPLIAAFGIIKGTSATIQFASGFLGKGVRGKFHSGGLVPGGKGVKDDYPATLQTGEYVIRREAVDAIGVDKLNALNQGRAKFAKGGKATSVSKDLRIGTPEAPLISGLFLQPTSGRGDAVADKAVTSENIKKALFKAGIIDANFKGKINIPVGKNFVDPDKAKKLKNLTETAIADLTLNTASLFGENPITDIDAYLEDVGIKDITGKVYEASLAAGLGIKRTGDSARGIDFEGEDIGKLNNVFGDIRSPFADAKLTDTIDSVRSIRDKIIARISSDPSFLAQYGSRIQRNKGGEVPALLTRGEFVMSKSASKRIGIAGLDALNNADRTGFKTGGGVGRRRKFPRGTLQGDIVKNSRSGLFEPVTQDDVIAQLLEELDNSSRFDDSGFFTKPRELPLGDIDFEEQPRPISETRRRKQRSRLSGIRIALARRLSPTRGISAEDIGGAVTAGGASGGVLPRSSGTLSKVLRTGSLRGVPGGVGGVLKAGVSRLGGVGAVAGVLGGQFVGDQIANSGFSGAKSLGAGVSGAIGGAAVGAQIGSAVPVIGTALGAIGGAVIGFANSFRQAKLEEELEKATSAVTEKTAAISEAFKQFEQTGDINVLKDNFKGLGTDLRRQIRTEDKAKTDFTNFSFSDFGDVGLFGGGGGSDTVAARIQEEKVRDLTAGKSLQAAIGSNGLEARAGLSARLKTQSLPDALADLTDDEAIAIAIELAKGNKSATEALGQAGLDQGKVKKFAKQTPEEIAAGADAKVIGETTKQATVARAQLAGNLGILGEQETILLDKKMQELAKSMQAADTGTDLLIDRLGNLSAVLDRVGESGEAARQANAALISRRSGGAGLANSPIRNTFANARGSTLGEIFDQANRINAASGNTKNSKEFTDTLKGANLVQRNLPRVLNDLSTQLKGFDAAQLGETSLVDNAVTSNFGSLPAVLQDKLKNDIRSQFLNRLSSPDQIGQEAAGGGLTEFAEKFAQDINEVGKKFVDMFNKNIAEYDAVLNTWVGLNAEANASLDKFVSLQTENALTLKQLSGKRLTASDLGANENNQISAFAQRAGLGAGPVSVGSIVQREQALTASIGRVSTGDAVDPGAQREEIAKLTVQQQNAVSALKAIVENTAESAALQSELNGIIDARGQARKILEDVQFGTPEERRQIEKQIGLANQLNNGGQVLPSQLKDARAGQDILKTFAAAQGPEAADAFDKQLLNRTANDPNNRRFFELTQKAGFNQGANLPDFLTLNDANARNRRAQIDDIGQRRIAAQGALANIDRRDANQFLRNGRETFDKSQQDLFNPDGLLNRLNDTLANINIPSKIEIGGAIKVELTLNGAVEGTVGPEVDKRIAEQVQAAIKKQFPPDGPSSRRA